MMSGTDYFSLRYMSSFVHIPLLQVDEPKSVLVLCFGVGNTLYAASLYPSVSRLEVADLSKNVLELAPYFGQWNKNVLQDTRVAVFVNDGRQHLRMQPDNQYDLVTLEPPPLSHAGVASLYSEEFYRIVYRTLKKGGYLSQWLPMYQVAEEHNLRLIKAFIDVFPNAVLLNGANKEFILLGQKEGPNRIDWKAAERRLSANDKVKREVEGLDLATPVERLGMFAASPNWLSMATRNVEPMTDDDPVIENNHFLRDRSMPKEIFNTSGLADWCPACFGEGSLASELAPLPYYLQVLQDIYSNDQFLLEGPFVPPREAYRIGFSKVDAGNVPIDSAHSVRHPTPQRFEELLRRYPYLAAFGPDWAFRYAR
jgi:spermidine synthase